MIAVLSMYEPRQVSRKGPSPVTPHVHRLLKLARGAISRRFRSEPACAPGLTGLIGSSRSKPLVAAVGCAALYVIWGRAWQLNWGSRAGEQLLLLPGDDLIDRADLMATRAIDIRCPPTSVWPWIAQIGQGRGGMYSYDALENLVGCDIHSADRIEPAWQSIAVGDAVRLAPEVQLTVAALEHGRALVLSGGVSVGGIPPPYDFTWSFVIQDAPNGWARLVVRERYAYQRPWACLLVEPTEIVSFFMSQKMLRGIRDRAEAMS